MRNLVCSIFALLALAISPVATAQQINTWVEASSEDVVGKQLIYQVRELLRASNAFKLIDSMAQANLVLRITSMDPDQDGSNSRSTYSFVITVQDLQLHTELFFNNLVGVCGSERIQSCARTIVSATDSAITDLKKQTAAPTPQKQPKIPTKSRERAM